jgi:dipeptidyl aminopeptidase/acylaminoacyl peptidase
MASPLIAARVGCLIALATSASACSLGSAGVHVHAAARPAGPGPVAFVATARGSADANVLAVRGPSRPAVPVTQGGPPVVDAAWSADGRRLVFARRGRRRVDVFVARRGGAPHLIRRCSLACNLHSFAWSPDGRRIAFVAGIRSSFTGTAGEIAVMDADGGEFHAVCDETVCGQGLDDPQWSPDGSALLFSNMGTMAFFGLGPLPSRIWIAGPDGTGARALTQPHCRPGHPPLRGCAYDSAATWSPDGRWIAFSRLIRSSGHRHGATSRTTIELMRADGSELHSLASCAGILCNQIMAPSWSPDGSRLAYIPRVERSPSIAIVGPAGRRTVVRACSGDHCITPGDLAWAPNGKELALVSGAKKPAAYLMRVTGGGLRSVGRDVQCCLAWLPAARRPS